jgi:hypothetical protein
LRIDRADLVGHERVTEPLKASREGGSGGDEIWCFGRVHALAGRWEWLAPREFVASERGIDSVFGQSI